MIRVIKFLLVAVPCALVVTWVLISTGSRVPESDALPVTTTSTTSTSTTTTTLPPSTSQPVVIVTPPPPPTTLQVVRVIDGDTIEMASGETVRLVGIDTPERGVCGFDEAKVRLEQLVLGQGVNLVTDGRDDRDRYDRLLRYVDVGGLDVGLVLVEEGLAVARYDSRDGYGHHPREDRYVWADAQSPNVCG